MANVAQMDSPGLGPRKTFFIMVTVIGCIAILWPKVFYPIMFGSGQNKNLMKDHRGTGCCDVVLDSDEFANVSITVGSQIFRKGLNLMPSDEISVRQERPPHLRPDTIHPAMRERGRAIPSTQTVPIIERVPSSVTPPRVVEGRPGPIPGMRPPMGAGSVHQPTPKANSMGFLMPLYTIGIVSFFIYTIMKIMFKKQANNSPYTAPIQQDSSFHRQVFEQDLSYIKRPDNNGSTKLGRNYHHQLHLNGGQSHQNGFSSATTVDQQAITVRTAIPLPSATTEICHRHQSTENTAATPIMSTATTISTPIKITTLDENVTKTSTNNTNDIQCDNGNRKKVEEIICKIREKEQLMEISLLRRKLQETENAMAKIIAQMGNVPLKGQNTTEHHQNGHLQPSISNGHAQIIDKSDTTSTTEAEEIEEDQRSEEEEEEIVDDLSEDISKVTNETDTSVSQNLTEISTNNGDIKKNVEDFIKKEQNVEKLDRKKRDANANDKGTVKVLGMEMTASCEGGQKWARPPTPVFNTTIILLQQQQHSPPAEAQPEPQSIFLEGALPHESQILVADSETTTENVLTDDEGVFEEPAVVLSSKMTLSLISLDPLEENYEKTQDSKYKNEETEEVVIEKNDDNAELKNEVDVTETEVVEDNVEDTKDATDFEEMEIVEVAEIDITEVEVAEIDVTEIEIEEIDVTEVEVEKIDGTEVEVEKTENAEEEHPQKTNNNVEAVIEDPKVV